MSNEISTKTDQELLDQVKAAQTALAVAIDAAQGAGLEVECRIDASDTAEEYDYGARKSKKKVRAIMPTANRRLK